MICRIKNKFTLLILNNLKRSPLPAMCLQNCAEFLQEQLNAERIRVMKILSGSEKLKMKKGKNLKENMKRAVRLLQCSKIYSGNWKKQRAAQPAHGKEITNSMRGGKNWILPNVKKIWCVLMKLKTLLSSCSLSLKQNLLLHEKELRRIYCARVMINLSTKN